MAKQAKIVSFNEIGRGTASSSTRSSSARSAASRRRSTRTRESSVRAAASSRQRTRQTRIQAEDDARDEAENELTDARAARAALKRRQRNCARADKMYEHQFGKEQDAGEEAGPRAAVYKGKVGKTQRKVARMVPARDAVAHAAMSLNPIAVLQGIRTSSKKLVLATVLACIVLAGIGLYVPAQQYYQSVRDNDRLQVQYAAIEDRSAALQEQNATLNSDAGIETIAHEQYGLIKSGEQSATVEGLSDSAYASASADDGVEANVNINDIGYPQTWYSPVLDALFGVGR